MVRPLFDLEFIQNGKGAVVEVGLNDLEFIQDGIGAVVEVGSNDLEFIQNGTWCSCGGRVQIT